ncbi:MAG: ankyrin repeat domain-containing protein, partial [Sphingobacteriaceae bacterium]
MDNLDEIIIHAARKGETGVIKELLEKSANINARDTKGYTPLIIACYNNQYD